MVGLIICILLSYLAICFLAGHRLCRWRDKILSHLNPGDDSLDEE